MPRIIKLQHMINSFVEQCQAGGSLGGVCCANGNIDFPSRKECEYIFEGFVHFSFTNDNLGLFILVERNEAPLNRRFEVMISRILLTMEFGQIVDVKCTIPD